MLPAFYTCAVLLLLLLLLLQAAHEPLHNIVAPLVAAAQKLVPKLPLPSGVAHVLGRGDTQDCAPPLPPVWLQQMPQRAWLLR